MRRLSAVPTLFQSLKPTSPQQAPFADLLTRACGGKSEPRLSSLDGGPGFLYNVWLFGCCRGTFPLWVIRFRNRRGLPAELRAGRAGIPAPVLAASSVAPKKLGPPFPGSASAEALAAEGSILRYPPQHGGAREACRRPFVAGGSAGSSVCAVTSRMMCLRGSRRNPWPGWCSLGAES